MIPRIGITCSCEIQRTSSGYEYPRLSLDVRFCERVREAGGDPVVIAPTVLVESQRHTLASLAGVILVGGPDVPPTRYGAEPHPLTKPMSELRADSDLRVAAWADERQLPVLAICCGVQEWNVHRGGTLHQHLPDLSAEPCVIHRDGDKFSRHPVRLAGGSLVQRIVGDNPLPVNSSHHQGIDRLGRGLIPTAWADDGLIEAVEDPTRPFCLGVQWHPEDMPDDPRQVRLLHALVEAAAAWARRSVEYDSVTL